MSQNIPEITWLTIFSRCPLEYSFQVILYKNSSEPTDFYSVLYLELSSTYNRRLKKSFLWTGQKCWYQQTRPAQFSQNHPTLFLRTSPGHNSNIYNSSINKTNPTSYFRGSKLNWIKSYPNKKIPRSYHSNFQSFNNEISGIFDLRNLLSKSLNSISGPKLPGFIGTFRKLNSNKSTKFEGVCKFLYCASM